MMIIYLFTYAHRSPSVLPILIFSYYLNLHAHASHRPYWPLVCTLRSGVPDGSRVFAFRFEYCAARRT